MQTGDGTPEIYARQSSHLQDQQFGKFKPNDKSIEGQEYLKAHQPRGCDFYEGTKQDGKAIGDPALLLPSGMRSLLYQQVEPQSGQSRLYIKMETEGARINPATPHYEGQFSSRPKDAADISRSLAHGANLAEKLLHGGQATQKDLPQLREDLPKPIRTAMKSLLSQAKQTDPEAYRILTTGTPHLGQISANIQSLDASGRVLPQPLRQSLDALRNTIEQTPLRGSQNLRDRFGEEVVLTGDHLRTAPAISGSTGQ
jgi:hypothetical protein